MYIGFTGHRPDKLYGYNLNNKKYNMLKEIIKTILLDIFSKHMYEKYYCITGGALGFDTLAFDTIEEIKQKNTFYIDNILAIPFEEQSIKWTKSSQDKYNKMKNDADNLIYVDTIKRYKINENIPQGKYHYKKLLNRNKFIGDISDILIACCLDLKSGTGNCIRYFKKVHPNGKVYLIDPRTYKISII